MAVKKKKKVTTRRTLNKYLIAFLVLQGIVILYITKLELGDILSGDLLHRNIPLFITSVFQLVLLLTMFFGVSFLKKIGVYASVLLYAVSVIKYYLFDLPPNFGLADTPPLSAFEEVGALTLVAFLYIWAIRRNWKLFS